MMTSLHTRFRLLLKKPRGRRPGICSIAVLTIVCIIPLATNAFNGTNANGIYQNPQKVFPIKGKITGPDNEPLAGVTIAVKGTNIISTTDAGGTYALDVPSGKATLVISNVGFTTREITLNNQLSLDIVLQKNQTALQEAVVVGYATQKKASVVGAISTVSNEALNRRGGVNNLASALSGQIGGVTVLETSGEPGRDNPQILIRGQSTWNGSQPLILVDGIERRMNDISVNEVATISVLKDASATAVFGVKGANGVILITTKRGKLGKPKLNLGAAMGIKTISKLPEKLNAYDAQMWKNAAVEREVSINEASWKYFLPYEQVLRSKTQEYPYLYPDVDWTEVMTRDYAKNYRATMDISGGTEFATYFASMSYVHEGDIFISEPNKAKGYDPGYSYDRFNFRGNLDFRLTKTTKLQTNINGYTGMQRKTGAFDGQDGHIYRAIYELAPDAFPVRYEDGIYGKDPVNLNMHNPLSLLQESGILIYNRRHIGMDFNLDQRLDFITKGLSAGFNLSWDSYSASNGPNVRDVSNQGQTLYKYVNPSILDAKNRQDSLNAITYFPSQGITGVNEFDFVIRPWQIASEFMNNADLNRALFYQGRLSYARKFGDHDVSALGIFNRRQEATGGEFARYREDWVGRVTYNYSNKYFLEVNGAYNGSEKFAPKYRFGFFPSAALGWMVTEEKFMSKLPFISKLKLRGSWGKVGSDAGIIRWGYIGSWVSGTASYMNNVNGTPLVLSPYGAYREGVIPNENISWETAIKQNLGMELSVLNDMFTVELDLFKDRREGIFMSALQRNVPVYFGAAPVPANLGKTETKGYELSLAYNKRQYKDGLGYWVKVDLSSAMDKVIVSEDPALLADYLKVAGYQIDQTKTQVRAGYITNWDEIYASSPLSSNMAQRLPGDWDLVDYNGDGVINTFDNVAFGYPTRPAKTYNATVGLTFKNFTLMAQFFAVTGISLRVPYMTPTAVRWSMVSGVVSDYWTPNNPGAFYNGPRLTTTSPVGDFGIYDGSYIRLKTAELSYDFTNTPMIKRLGLSNLRIYVNGNNLVFWSDLPMDRETGNFDIHNAYPMFKQFNIGFDIGL
jgi:TonB-linked SusC/RagA family outer membrane protein